MAGALLAAFGGFAGFNLMLSAMPAYAVRSGAGPSGAGALTATLMAATLVVQPFTPWLFARLGRRHSLALSGALLGLPCLALPAASTLPTLSALAVVRGLGFGLFVVAGVTFTAELFPSGNRGRAIGWYGAVVGVAGVLGAPLGIALARREAYTLAFALAAGTAALVLVGSFGFPRAGAPARPAGPRSGRPRTLHGTWRSLRPMTGPLLVETASTTAYGVVFTFLPLTASAAPEALLATQASTVLSRLGAGWLIDRYGGRQVLVPAVLVTTLGTAACAADHEPALLLSGTALFGAGFGAVQSATLVLAMQAVGDRPGGLGVAGVAWNVAFDGGTGIGSLAGGPLLALGGPSALYPATAAVLAAFLLLDLRTARRPDSRNCGAVQDK
ncbi:MFS transporter [Streptomyces phaeofaciens JCM 4814]|uniref:MFS transporter n=1 Tax=Streptomyces phaeofaciens TaxID=68254 RepID=A0A918HMB2_9ACTN|nr:MFS transporter [Streptomyces phaeofaciens]GGT80192.1 MFS transporter [Streptomyces phaeofaciens]